MAFLLGQKSFARYARYGNKKDRQYFVLLYLFFSFSMARYLYLIYILFFIFYFFLYRVLGGSIYVCIGILNFL